MLSPNRGHFGQRPLRAPLDQHVERPQFTRAPTEAPAWRIFLYWLPFAAVWPLASFITTGRSNLTAVALAFGSLVAIVSPCCYLVGRRLFPGLVRSNTVTFLSLLAPFAMVVVLGMLGLLTLH